MTGERDPATVHSLLSEDDLYLFNEGTHRHLDEKLGAHPVTVDRTKGTVFGVWAPAAGRVSVVGDFNGWDPGAHPLAPRAGSGIWEGFVAGVGPGAVYKYRIESRRGGYRVDKADPFAFAAEVSPRTASVVADLEYSWGDGAWMAGRHGRAALDRPMAVYEVHLGSWRREDGRMLGYREIAAPLAEHVRRMGFTHVELLPVMEHPFYGSWGYQTTGYFAPTSRYGTPQDLMALVDHLHQHGIGVILDWVPSHFATDEHGLGRFDGTHLFEHADPRQGRHPDWDSYVFNYGRNEVRSFLLSSARFWLDRYHADGLRVDAVASMLYLDYSREQGEWIPNRYGGRENLEALDFLRALNAAVYEDFPDVQTIAEESTAWPMVSRPTYLGGLGFGLKWDMGWMHDTLGYFAREPVHRAWHHHELTFRAIYQFHENFVLPLSHDEVVHGKGSLLAKMPGDAWQQRANLRLLLGTMYGQPGKKLLFMGAELGTYREWSHEAQLEWELLDDPERSGIARWLADLNRVYTAERALHELDCDPEGFAWVTADDAAHSVLAWVRRDRDGHEVLVVANLTPVVRQNYRVGVSRDGWWSEVLNSDAEEYGGSGVGNLGRVETHPVPYHDRPFSLVLTLPPLGVVVLAWSGAHSGADRR
ncbi:MAG: 1,4-alpha-glucan branching protein GlgB [Acidimicrobiia bacterium]|nr:1,4-alpha-glucan branching protein GlgB [Acidimicrobiia bacterium]